MMRLLLLALLPLPLSAWSATTLVVGNLTVGSASGGGGGGGNTPCAVTNGIAGYWSFNNTYADGSGLGNNLAPNGSPAFVGGYTFGALEVDEAGYASIADNVTLGLGGDTSVTISTWINLQGSLTTKVIIGKGDITSGNSDYTFLIYSLSSGITFGIGDAASHAIAITDSTIGSGLSQGVWHHIVGVYNSVNQTANIYVNGNGNTPVSWTHGTPRNSLPFTVGANSDGGFTFNGWIDETVIWTNRALPGTEISQLYTASTRGLTPTNYCSSTAVGRTEVLFAMGARGFQGNNPGAHLPGIFITNSWAVAHDARMLFLPSLYAIFATDPNPPELPTCGTNNLGGWPPFTNQTTCVTKYVGLNTNLYLVPCVGWENDVIGINNSQFPAGVNSNTVALNLTNFVTQLITAGAKVVHSTNPSFPGATDDENAGILWINQCVTNMVGPLGYLDAAPLFPTNAVPSWFIPGGGELTDDGNYRWATNLNNTFNARVP